MSDTNGKKSIVKLKGVAKTYERGKQPIPVLEGIDLEIPEGSFEALMGPSGSGKTTLLNLIAGIDHASAGSVAGVPAEPGASEPPFERAIRVLRELVADFPQADIYASELVETFAQLDRSLDPRTLAQLREENAQLRREVKRLGDERRQVLTQVDMILKDINKLDLDRPHE